MARASTSFLVLVVLQFPIFFYMFMDDNIEMGKNLFKFFSLLSPERKKSVHAQLYLGFAKPVSVRHLSSPS